MTPAFQPEKVLCFTLLFLRGYMAALLVFGIGNAAVFGNLAYALFVRRDATHLAANWRHSQLQLFDFQLFAVAFAAVVIGLAVWLMDTVDQRLRWRRRRQTQASVALASEGSSL